MSGDMGFQLTTKSRKNAEGVRLAKQLALLELFFLFATAALSWRPDGLWWRVYLAAVHPQGYALAGLLAFSGLGLVRLLPEWPRGGERRGWQWWIFTVAFSVILLALGFLAWPGYGPTE